jgi:hypothetical protein
VKYFFLSLTAVAVAQTPITQTPGALDRDFQQIVRPFVASYCAGCHSGEKPAAQLDLKQHTSLALVVRDQAHWATVAEKLTAHQMPPAQAKQPPPAERQRVVDWIHLVRRIEARRNAGDPGIVLARRLSNAEYNYTIRDLTGADIRPTREFPVDPANPAGFDNSGESLSMSPALLNKYLQAAREVSNHLVLKPDGLAFATHPMLVETDRDKYCVRQIVDFYESQNTDYAGYFTAAWRYRNRAVLGQPSATLASIAAAARVSPKYLATVWRALELTREDVGPGARLQAMWRALPTQAVPARTGCEQMRDYVVKLRKKLEPRFANLPVKGLGATSQPLHMWKNRQYATHRMTFDHAALKEDAGDPDLRIPPGERARYEAAFARFSAVFPDAFYIRERGRNYLDPTTDKGRLLSAGFHNLMGYFRDDQPLYELVLDAKQQQRLDALWRELDFVASAGIRTYLQFFFNESGEARGTGRESEGPRPTDRDVTSEAMIRQVKETYLTRIRASGNAEANQAIEDHFNWVNAGIRWVERARAESEPLHLAALADFATRAYRRPLTAAERQDLTANYRALRETSKLSHEEALRDSVLGILMSPYFLYRVDLVETSSGPAGPLSDAALASRLSYFLWSSMPDAPLLARVAAGTLRQPGVLAAEARRMLADPRARALATEFAGNWLDFRRFEEHNAVDRERFPAFNNDLRQAMFEEPVRFVADVIAHDRSVLDFLYARRTMVNPVLAKHYGIPWPANGGDGWVTVEDARRYGRGGLLPMAAFLTKNAPGLRTSPVKRGYWVVKRVLGEEIPPPPAVVPELPQDEAKLDLPLREMLARHRQDPNCAGCHARFDAMGLAFEGYGPVGERRTKDLAGREVDARSTYPGGKEGDGFEGLLAYVRASREKDFVDNLCRKLLVYGIGRSLQLSDEPTVETMRAQLAAKGYRFSSLVETIVTSPQFRTKRANPPAAPNRSSER